MLQVPFKNIEKPRPRDVIRRSLDPAGVASSNASIYNHLRAPVRQGCLVTVEPEQGCVTAVQIFTHAHAVSKSGLQKSTQKYCLVLSQGKGVPNCPKSSYRRPVEHAITQTIFNYPGLGLGLDEVCSKPSVHKMQVLPRIADCK